MFCPASRYCSHFPLVPHAILSASVLNRALQNFIFVILKEFARNLATHTFLVIFFTLLFLRQGEKKCLETSGEIVCTDISVPYISFKGIEFTDMSALCIEVLDVSNEAIFLRCKDFIGVIFKLFPFDVLAGTF